MKVIDGGSVDLEDGDLVVEFVLTVAIDDVMARAEGRPRSREPVVTWAGGFVLGAADRAQRPGTAARRGSGAAGRREPVALPGVQPRDRVVAEGVAELLVGWAQAHNAV